MVGQCTGSLAAKRDSAWFLPPIPFNQRGQLTAIARPRAGDASLPLKVLPAPCSNDLDQRTDGFSVARDAVVNPRRDLRINIATGHPLAVQTPERLHHGLM